MSVGWSRLHWKDYVLIAFSTTALALGDYVFFLMLPALLLGILFNVLVCHANGGRMPIYVPKNEFLRTLVVSQIQNSEYHCEMTSEARLRFLCDIYSTPFGMSSIGDFLIDASDVLKWTYGLFLIARWIYSFFA